MNEQYHQAPPDRVPQYGEVPPEPARKNSALGIVSMIAGIAGLALIYFAIPAGVTAIVLAITDRIREKKFSGFSKAGLITGIVAVALWLLIVGILIAVWASDPSAFKAAAEEAAAEISKFFP